MTNVLTVFLHELRVNFRRKAYLFITFIIPLLAIAAFYGYRFYQDQQDKEDKPAESITQEVEENKSIIGYVDRTPQQLFPAPDTYPDVDCTLGGASDLNAELIKRITSPRCIGRDLRVFATYADGKKALKDGDIDVLYVIEPTYVEDGAISGYMEGLNLQGASSDQVMEGYILATLLQNAPPEEYQQLFLRLRDPAAITEHRVSDSGGTAAANDDRNYMLVYGFGLIFMMSVFWGGGYLMQSVVQEKETRIVEIILSSIRPLPLLTGKVLANGVLSLLQMGTLLGTFIFLATQAGDLVDSLGGIDVPVSTLILSVVYFLLGFLFFGSLMGAIGAMSTTMRESQNFVAVVTLPAAIPFFVLTEFAEEPNGSLAKVLSLIPFTSPLSMVMRLSVADVPVGEIALSVIILALSVAAAVWLASRLFRVNILLSGTLPKLKDIPKLIRG